VADEHGGTGEFAEMDFWDGLATARAVSNHDALHALLLSFAAPTEGGFAARLAEAKKRGWVEEDLVANETAKVGWIARAVCIEAGIKGGLTMRVAGPAPRYAVRELNYREWLPNMSPDQAISGMQLISLLSSVEDERKGGPDVPREDLK
jgi:hypothetical protein